jgi:hypothetical protein
MKRFYCVQCNGCSDGFWRLKSYCVVDTYISRVVPVTFLNTGATFRTTSDYPGRTGENADEVVGVPSPAVQLVCVMF